MALFKDKYKTDYKNERYYTPAGVIKYRTVYVGKHFEYVSPPAERKKLRVFYGAGCLAAWALLLTSLFLNGLLGRLWWVIIPYVFALIPLCYLTGGVLRLVFCKEPLIREDSEKISSRTGACCAVLFALAGAVTVSALLSDVLFRAALVLPDDVLFPALSALLCALCVWMFTRRKKLATREKEK